MFRGVCSTIGEKNPDQTERLGKKTIPFICKTSHKLSTTKGGREGKSKTPPLHYQQRKKWRGYLVSNILHTAQMSALMVFCGPHLSLAFQFVCGPKFAPSALKSLKSLPRKQNCKSYQIRTEVAASEKIKADIFLSEKMVKPSGYPKSVLLWPK